MSEAIFLGILSIVMDLLLNIDKPIKNNLRCQCFALKFSF